MFRTSYVLTIVVFAVLTCIGTLSLQIPYEWKLVFTAMGVVAVLGSGYYHDLYDATKDVTFLDMRALGTFFFYPMVIIGIDQILMIVFHRPMEDYNPAVSLTLGVVFAFIMAVLYHNDHDRKYGKKEY